MCIGTPNTNRTRVRRGDVQQEERFTERQKRHSFEPLNGQTTTADVVSLYVRQHRRYTTRRLTHYGVAEAGPDRTEDPNVTQTLSSGPCLDTRPAQTDGSRRVNDKRPSTS